uniref:O-acyltransferase n=1 Tax=Meloidogyne incognita TaxID=6306 RepID=A0A914MM21_MELIC
MKNKEVNVHKEKGKNSSIFREKEFVERPSLLEKHFNAENGQYLELYNFFLAVFILAVMGTWLHDFYIYGNPLHHLWLFRWNFIQFPQTMLIWLIMFLSTLIFPFYLFNFKTTTFINFWLFIFIYCLYQVGLFYFSLKALFWLELRGACCFVITCENTRIAMKVHSFVRENFCTTLAKLSSKTTEQSCDNVKNSDASEGVANSQNSTNTPSLTHFVYFMFCPALLYRHSYPMSQTRSWRKVFNHFLHCLASIYAVNISFTQVVIPLFSRIQYGEDGLYLVLLTAIFPSIIPGSVCLFIGIFYGLLHSWLSMFAEAMYFADRHFYSNWWSSRNMAYYYRSWNLVVHEWLYTYIYRDISNLLGSTTFGNALAQMSVFFISAVFHEYWFTVSLRMFYPIIFFLYFVIGGIIFLLSNLIKKPSSTWNVVLWWNLMLGTGIFFACYASEWYARQKCSKIYENNLLDLLIPRVWDCQHRLK